MTVMAGPEPCNRFEWERVVRRLGFPMRLKLVALTLATYADKDGSRVRPGVHALAAVTGQGESTVRRLLAALRESGLIVQVSRGGGRSGHGKAAEYRLTLPPDVDALVLLPPSEVPPLSMASAQSDDSPLAQESAQSGPSPVDNSESPLASASAQSEAHEPIDRSENTVTDRLTARSERLSARLGERLPSDHPPKETKPSGPDPTQPQTARDADEKPIELRPRNCPHGLPAHRDANGNPTCPLCRRGLPATEKPMTTPITALHDCGLTFHQTSPLRTAGYDTAEAVAELVDQHRATPNDSKLSQLSGMGPRRLDLVCEAVDTWRTR